MTISEPMNDPMYKKLLKYDNCLARMKTLNYKLIPTTTLGANKESAKIFNEIYDWIRRLDLPYLKRTKSGGISKAAENYMGCGWCVDADKNNSVELIIIYYRMWKIRFKARKDEGEVAGWEAWETWLKICEKFGIDMDDYTIDNGPEVKKEIESWMIWFNDKYIDMTINGVHHIDLRSAFGGGLIETHPVFKEPMEYVYKKRKTSAKYKSVIVNTIGCFQSLKKPWEARWAHLAKDAIKWCNDTIRDIARRLEESGRVLIAFNTDGIWYAGEVYHGEGEGDNIGQWSNDHINCKIRFKSKGAYEYEEDGTYHPVIRGSTGLDKVKPRSEWQWGDIYSKEAKVLKFYFDPEVGITDEFGGRY